MASLAKKQQQAPAYLALAVDLACECIRSASRRVSNKSLLEIIRRKFDQYKRVLWYTLRLEVTDRGVSILDGDEHDKNHAHISISHETATPHYWRNYGEPHGPQNYL